MEKIRVGRKHARNTESSVDRGAELERLIGQMEQSAPQGSALDNKGEAPQASCGWRIYCVP